MPLFKPLRGIQLNRSHPLTRDLVLALVMNEGTGDKLFDVASKIVSDSFYGDTMWVVGPNGSCLSFDGNGDYVQTALPSGITYANPVSVSFWAKCNATNKGVINIQAENADSGQILTIYFWSGTGYTGILAGRKVNSSLSVQPAISITQNIWNHFVATCPGGDVCPTLYVNGLLNSAAKAEVWTRFGTNVIQIGKGLTTPTYDFNGLVDGVTIYNRTLLASEIAWLYREPFAMFERVSVGKLLYTIPAVVWLAGSAEAQSATSAMLKQLIRIAGSATAQSQGSALCKTTKKVIATAANTAYLYGILTSSTRLPWFAGSLERERPWLREVLFNCVSANAFKLGTALSGGWFWVRVSGCSALYRGATMGEVDFTNILTVTAQDAREIRPPSYLLHSSNSTYFYVVRRFNNCGYRECTLSAAVKVSIDAAGELARPQPNNIFCSKTEQMDGNKIHLVWFYCPLEQKSKPAHFKIYWDSRTGQIDYENPIATISYQGRKYYNYKTGAIEAGRYLFTIRAEDANGAENNSLAQSKIDVHTRSPDSITISSAEAI